MRLTIFEPTNHKFPRGRIEITPIDKKYVREELHIIPERMYIERIYVRTYKCQHCAQDAIVSGLSQDGLAPALISHSLVSASLVAEILYRKFVLGVPLYRQLPSMAQLGYDTSEATLANWGSKKSELVTPLYSELHQQLCQGHHLQGDETPTEVLREPGNN